VNKCGETGSLLDKKEKKSKRRVVTEEKLDEINARLQRLSLNPLVRLVHGTGVSGF
jgi:isopentenyl phosphate kinase